MTASVITFDLVKFRALYPEFLAVSDTALASYWDVATVYVSAEDSACFMLTGKARELALYQMTAHMTAISVAIAAGNPPEIQTAATIDKVSVTVQPPPVKTLFESWLAATPYGRQLLALLAGAVAGGLYIPGGSVPERSGFRTAGGGFGGARWPR